MDTPTPESYRVNVPMADAAGMGEAPDSGYALVKYTKDEDGYCLDLATLRLPDEQPAEENPDDDLPLEDFARKVAKDEGMKVDDNDGE